MADFNSSLPVIGSQHVTQSTSPWVVSGTISVDTLPIGSNFTLSSAGSIGVYWPVTGSIVISGTSIPVFRGIGSIRIAEQGVVPLNVTGSFIPYGIGSVLVTGTVSTTAGTRSNLINDYISGLSIAAGGSDIHTYISTGSSYISRIMAAFSGKAKINVAISGTSMLFKATGFNSTADPNIILDFGEENGLFVGNGSGLSVIRYNRESASAQDVYSTIIGYTPS